RHASRRSRDSDRRGVDARLVSLLAARRLSARRRATELRQAVRPRLSRADPLEQAAARAVAALGRRRENAPEIPGSVPPPDRPGTRVGLAVISACGPSERERASERERGWGPASAALSRCEARRRRATAPGVGSPARVRND